MKSSKGLLRLYDSYNQMLFNNELNSEIAVEYADLTKGELYGNFDCVDGCISIRHVLPHGQIKSVLIHEMIHVWQWEKYRQLNHKKRFVTKAAELSNILGFKIPIYIDDLFD